MIDQRKKSTADVKSNNSSTLSEVLAWKPRLFLLIGGFISVCAVTVGVLGWQLTIAAGKDNVSAMIEEIEFLIINQLAVYINQAGESLTRITQISSDNFQVGKSQIVKIY
ncbi:UNVERIFIED_CONTAM: hypothetical protein HDU68_003601 [Siphonaria sp. JEL0065]|nr:hypothetical protein HDU68_003601 [Siphonaria sp. JEL0065]